MRKKLLSLKRKLRMILTPASRNQRRPKFTSGRGQIIIALRENFAEEIDDAINDAVEIGVRKSLMMKRNKLNFQKRRKCWVKRRGKTV